MVELSRRSFIHKVGGLSLLGATYPLASALDFHSEKRITLNVVLHGLYVMDFQTDCIQLLTPFIKEHVYKAGNWDKCQVEDLCGKKVYRLYGTDPITAPPSIDEACNVVLSHEQKDFDLNPDLSYFIVQLPYPATIRSLRCVHDSNKSAAYRRSAAAFCGGYSSGGTETIEVYTLSLCQALVYPVSDYRSLKLRNTCWKPRVDEETATANLHLWAEPKTRQTNCHAAYAYSKLSDLLPPLTMELRTDKTAPLDTDTGVCGLSSEEEQGWAEWENAGEGSHPTNCCTVIVKPSTPSH